MPPPPPPGPAPSSWSAHHREEPEFGDFEAIVPHEPELGGHMTQSSDDDFPDLLDIALEPLGQGDTLREDPGLGELDLEVATDVRKSFELVLPAHRTSAREGGDAMEDSWDDLFSPQGEEHDPNAD